MKYDLGVGATALALTPCRQHSTCQQLHPSVSWHRNQKLNLRRTFCLYQSSQPSAVSGFSVPSLNTSPASLMQSCCVLCRCLCRPTMAWFARSSVFSPLTCTGLRSRFFGNPLTWDCKTIQITVYRFPWISENKLLEWKMAKDKWRSVPKDFWVYLSASEGKDLSWGLQPFISTGKWHIAT